MTSDADGRPPPDPSPPDARPLAGDPSDSDTPNEPGTPDAPILDQAFDADSLYTLRSAVAAHATQAGLSPGRADDLVIAVHELAANAVRHGAGHGRLRIWRSRHALRCEISDDGVAQAPGTDGHNQDAAQWRTEPGHGLSLVRQVADQTSLRSGPSGTLAVISFALAAPGPPFRLDRRHQGLCTVLAVTGPLDLSSASQLTDAIDALPEQAAERLVLDLSGLTGWDSAGLATLITAQQRISGRPPARMVLAALPAHLTKHLHDAGLADRFTLADTTRVAVRTLT